MAMKWQDPPTPWIPTPQQIVKLKADLENWIISDNRLMVYHHGLTIDELAKR